MKKTKYDPEMQKAVNEFWKAIDSICTDFNPENKARHQKVLKARLKFTGGDAGMPAGEFNESKEFEL